MCGSLQLGECLGKKNEGSWGYMKVHGGAAYRAYSPLPIWGPMYTKRVRTLVLIQTG